MTYRIEVGPKPEIDDPRGAAAARQAREFLGLSVDTIRTRSVYKIAGLELVEGDLERIRLALADPVLEQSALDRMPLPVGVTWVIGVGFLPGVTDNLGRTARVFLADVLGRDLPAGARVFTETLYLIQGDDLDLAAVDRIADELLANRLIQSVATSAAGQYARLPADLEIPQAGGAEEPAAEPVPLPASDQALAALSRERTLSLSLQELRAIRAHFAADAQQARRKELGPARRTPPTWSSRPWPRPGPSTASTRSSTPGSATADGTGERETIDSLFKTYIVGADPRRSRERVDWLVSVFDDNAGHRAARRPTTNLVFKVETHNSPSALDPYGGAITGIVGVNRDPFGTGHRGRAADQRLGLLPGGPPFHDGRRPRGLLHPRRIRDGVHQGVIDGGNQSGIPYSRGFEIFDERYLGKPLVFCGTVGVMPADDRRAAQPSTRRSSPGDLVVMVGGRIGKDGIHGATFSSEALHGSRRPRRCRSAIPSPRR